MVNELGAFGPCFIYSLCEYVHDPAMFLHIYFLPLPLSASTPTYCTPSPSPSPFFLFDIFRLFAVLRNQVIFRKLEVEPCRVHSLSLCTSLHIITSFFLLPLLIFLFPSTIPPLQGKWSLGKTPDPPALELFNHIFRILMEQFTVDNISSTSSTPSVY